MAAAIPIIDSHVHILQPSHWQYHWLAAASPLNRDFHLSDLQEEMKAVGVMGGILLEATNTPDEIPWLLKISETETMTWGVIGWLHLEQSDVVEQLAHFARHPNFKGIRLNWLEPRPNPTGLNKAMLAASAAELVVEILANPAHLPEIAAFVHRHPYVSFVLEHLGGVVITDASLSTWQELMQPFAVLSNIAVKISGYPVSTAVMSLRAYIEIAIDLFGSQRLMFGSNYPMNTTSYAEIVTLLQQATGDLGETVQTALFYETARQIYRFS